MFWFILKEVVATMLFGLVACLTTIQFTIVMED